MDIITQRKNPKMVVTGDAKRAAMHQAQGSNWPRDDRFPRSQERSVQEDDTKRIPSVFEFME